jgi:hypothetical protein
MSGLSLDQEETTTSMLSTTFGDAAGDVHVVRSVLVHRVLRHYEFVFPVGRRGGSVEWRSRTAERSEVCGTLSGDSS